MRPYRFLLGVLLVVLLGSCSFVDGIMFRVLTPSPDQFLPLIARVAPNAGFATHGAHCMARREVTTYCAELPTRSGDHTILMHAFTENDVLYLAVMPTMINTAISRKLRSKIYAALRDLKAGGVELRLDHSYGPWRLPKDL